jgi:dTDP-4-dehydrorhamnose reductase
MKILVTGANGQVGHCLAQQLSTKKEWNVKALTRTELDIANEKTVTRFIAEYKPNIVINAAAYTAVDKAESDRENAFQVNRDGPAYLARAAR